MTSGERKWALMYGLGLAVVCTVPFLLGYAHGDPAWTFSGFLFGVEDGNSYIAKMLLGAYGDWRFRTPYTVMPQQGEFIFLPYLLLGKLAQPPALHLQLVALFHLFRIIVTPYVALCIYRFSTLFLGERNWRRWVTVLATCGGGAGWILPLLGRTELLESLPLDFISPESFGFLAILGLPHLILARGLMFAALYAYLKDGKERSASYSAGIYLLLLTLVQSLSTLSAIAVVAIHQGLMIIRDFRSGTGDWRGSWLGAAIRFVLPSMPLIVYYSVRFSTDPFLQAWTDQNRILSPHPIHYLLAYGVIGLPVLAAIMKKLWLEHPAWLLPAGWVVAMPLLAYFPHNLQRRLVEGIWVSLLVLAAASLQKWISARPFLRPIRLLVTVSAFISPVMLLVGALQIASRPASPAFVETDQVGAFQWLEKNAARGSVVVADYQMSNALPAWSPVQVLIGHGPESIGLMELKPQVDAFLDGEWRSDVQLDWLEQYHVDYAILMERQGLRDGWNPGQTGYLSGVYMKNGVVIYEVHHAQD